MCQPDLMKLYHASPIPARASIQAEGLRTSIPGSAGHWTSTAGDEPSGVYVFQDEDNVHRWVMNCHHMMGVDGPIDTTYDVWEIDADGLRTVPDPVLSQQDRWPDAVYVPNDIEAWRVRLHETVEDVCDKYVEVEYRDAPDPKRQVSSILYGASPLSIGVEQDVWDQAAKAQQELLDWIVRWTAAREQVAAQYDAPPGGREPITWSGGNLIEYYQEKWEEGKDDFLKGHHTTSRRHGWRRAGGTALMRLEEKECLKLRRITYGVPYYTLTDTGIELANKED